MLAVNDKCPTLSVRPEDADGRSPDRASTHGMPSNSSGNTCGLSDFAAVREVHEDRTAPASSNRSFWQGVGGRASRLRVPKAVVVEFYTTAIFCYLSAGVVTRINRFLPDNEAVAQVLVAIAHFFLLYVLIEATWPLSGAHFNPMVTVMNGVLGAKPWRQVLSYVCAQLLGAICGSLLHRATWHPSEFSLRDVGLQLVPEDMTIAQAAAGEFTAACALILTVCTVGVDPAGNTKRIAVITALTVALLILVVGPVSSMCINPARGFGPAVAFWYWNNHWLWWTAPFAGGLTVAVPYRLCLLWQPSSKKETEHNGV